MILLGVGPASNNSNLAHSAISQCTGLGLINLHTVREVNSNHMPVQINCWHCQYTNLFLEQRNNNIRETRNMWNIWKLQPTISVSMNLFLSKKHEKLSEEELYPVYSLGPAKWASQLICKPYQMRGTTAAKQCSGTSDSPTATGHKLTVLAQCSGSSSSHSWGIKKHFQCFSIFKISNIRIY